MPVVSGPGCGSVGGTTNAWEPCPTIFPVAGVKAGSDAGSRTNAPVRL